MSLMLSNELMTHMRLSKLKQISLKILKQIETQAPHLALLRSPSVYLLDSLCGFHTLLSFSCKKIEKLISHLDYKTTNSSFKKETN